MPPSLASRPFCQTAKNPRAMMRALETSTTSKALIIITTTFGVIVNEEGKGREGKQGRKKYYWIFTTYSKSGNRRETEREREWITEYDFQVEIDNATSVRITLCLLAIPTTPKAANTKGKR